MTNFKLRTPEGTKDYLFDEVTARNKISGELGSLFYQNGYSEVVTPSLEYLDVFLQKGRGIPVEDMYKLVSNDGRLLVMRPDSTTPIARLCASRLKDETLPIRLFYNQTVYSTERELSGKSHEVLQSGIELFAKPCIKSDLEALTLAINALEKLSPLKFRIEIGHIGIFNGLVEALDTDEDTKEQIRTLIESKNYPALNDMLLKLEDSYEVSVLKQLPRLFGNEEVFDRALKIIKDEKTVSVLNYLKELYNDLCKFNTNVKITVDLGIVNRTDYYTGIVFKGYAEGFFGEAVLSGGRYDNLLESFGKESGAIGFAVNVDASVKALMPYLNDSTKEKVLIFSENGYELKALEYKKTFEGKKTALFCLCGTLQEAKAEAERKGIRTLHIVGEDIKEMSL